MLLHLALAIDLFEDFRPPPQDADLVGLGGAAGAVVERLLDAAVAHGSDVLNRISKAAVTRLLSRHPVAYIYPQRLFTDVELAELAEALAAVNSTSLLLGRSLVRDYAVRIESGQARESLLLEAVIGPVGPLTPESALQYFLNLVPTLGVDPLRFGADMRRHAFTLAVAADRTLLTDVQSIIGEIIRTGMVPSGTPRLIQDVLDVAGVSPRNPQYSEMVFRTNAMDAYNQGSWQEMTHPEVIETFPVWQYSAIVDERSRPHHAARDGLYYPASIPFVQVRGLGIADAANCRCTFIPISKYEWAVLQGRGVRPAA